MHSSPEVLKVSTETKNLMWHKSAIGLAMQKDIKVEKFARTNFADRMGASELFGSATLRVDHLCLVKS